MEQSLFWTTDGTGDGPTEGYTQAQVREWQRMCWNQNPATQGVAHNYYGELEVTNPEWQTLEVARGGGVVYGSPYWTTGVTTFLLPIPTLGTTGWRMVLRVDWALQTVRLALLQSADGGAGYPGLTQTAGYRWEISLAHGLITVGGAVTIVADDRAFLGSMSGINHSDIANRTRRFFVPGLVGYNLTADEPIPRFAIRGLEFVNNAVCSAYNTFAIPADYVSSMVITLIVDPEANGNILCNSAAYYWTCDETWNQHSDMLWAQVVPIAANLRNCIVPLSLTNIAIGDIVDLAVDREATPLDVADTVEHWVYFVGWLVEYTADM